MGISRERVRQIGAVAGITSIYFQNMREQKEEQQKLHTPYQTLVNTLEQYYFNRLIKEEGLSHALAWRYLKHHAHACRYTAEQLEAIIDYRMQGYGHYRILRATGIAKNPVELRTLIPNIAKILTIALADVDYQKPKYGWQKHRN